MKIIRRDLGSEFKEIEILALGDWHIGNKESRHDTIEKKIEYIKNTPNAFCGLMGDLMECIIKDSLGDPLSQDLTPQEQKWKVIELLEPIKHKILFIVSGNHELRIYKATSEDISLDVAKILGLEDYYDQTAIYAFISFGKNRGRESNRHTIRIYAKHNANNGTKTSSSINSLEAMANIVDADIYIGAHTHTPVVFVKPYSIGLSRSKTMKQKVRAFVNGGADLGYADYAEKKSYEPKSIALVSVIVKIIVYTKQNKADDLAMRTKLEVMYWK